MDCLSCFEHSPQAIISVGASIYRVTVARSAFDVRRARSRPLVAHSSLSQHMCLALAAHLPHIPRGYVHIQYNRKKQCQY